MAVKWTTAKSKFPDMKAAAKSLKGRKVQVGCTGENAWLAGIHEYGCRIKVTPKMRAWFARNGFPLKKSTTEIVIPERSFLRAGFDESAEEVLEKLGGALSTALGGGPVDRYLQGVGTELASQIKKYARDLSDPPNASMTRERKGSSNPLVDTGGLVESINYEVE